jgi:hypothetical protein
MRFRQLAPLFCLFVTTLLLWCAATDRWTPAAWHAPLQFHGDPLEVYARVQLASEDLSQPIRGFSDLPRLAAPLGADWRAYPISDRVVFTGLGLLAKAVGLFLAMNLAMAAVHALNAISFYLCARFLHWRWEWAFATALLFSFSNYNLRWGVTISFSLTFAVPPLLLLCGWIARNAPPVLPRRWLLAAGALGAWFATANPYLSFFAAQLVALSAGLQLLRRRDPSRLKVALVFFAVLAAGFILHYLPWLLARGEAPTLARNFTGSEIYALKLADLVIPPSEHHVTALANWGRAYFAQSVLRGEFFVNYLGIFGIAGLAIIVWRTVRSVGSPRQPLPDAALGVAWTLIFSSVGGFNTLLAFAGLDLFRASSRNSIFLLVWALWFFGAWCQRRWRFGHPLLRFSLPIAVAAVGLFDSIPKLRAHAILRDNLTTLRSYESLMLQLETSLGSGARVFQIPSPPFPEAGRVGSMNDYEQFLPFLTSDTLRFSYGAFRETPTALFLDALAEARASMLRETLERTGFSAIWIDRRGLAPQRSALPDQLRAAGLTEYPQTSLPHIVIFLLQPAANPSPPDLFDPRIHRLWNPSKEASPRLSAISGWHALERNDSAVWRWAGKTAVAGLALEDDATVELAFTPFSAGAPASLTVLLDGRSIWERSIDAASRDPQRIQLSLTAGAHRLEWRFAGPLKRASPGDPRQIAFGIADFTAGVLAAAP